MLNQKLYINLSHGWLGKKMRRILGRNLGQATTEIAVMGTIILVIFGVLIRYGQMFNAQQEAQMYAFRKSIELAQKRVNARAYGSVTLLAMKDYPQVDLFSSEPQKSYASGSASVNLEPMQMFFNKKNKPSTYVVRKDFPISYYQIGNEMIENKELIEVPFMHVKRKPSDKGASTPLTSIMEVIDDDDPFDSYEPAPFWETNQTTNSTYASQEQRIAYHSPGVKSDYSETSSKELEESTIYETQPRNKIYASDDLIVDIYSLPPDMEVDINQTIEKERSYSAWD